MTDLVDAPAAAPSRTAVRIGAVSLAWRPRPVLVALALAAGVVLLAVLSVGRGDVPLTPGQVLGVLTGGGDAADRFVVLELRLPRVLTGVLVGLALGLSGALTQAVTRNALASPDIMGITAGAGTAAVAVLVLGGGAGVGAASAGPGPLELVGLPLVALAGGLLTAAAVYLLAWRDGVDGHRLVLVGIGLGALCTAATSWLLIRAEVTEAARATVWLTGSLNGRGWEHVVPLAVTLALGTVAAVATARTLRAMSMGDDTARGLGVRAQSGRAALVVLAVALAAVATAAAGPVAFVALVAPQVALRLVRSAGPPPATAALTGALLLVGSDLVARTVLPVELPVGIVTAALGAPFLIHLLLTAGRKVSR